MIRYFRNLMKYFYLVIIIAALIVAIMYTAVIRNYEPSYESKTTLLVSPSLNDRQYEAYVVLQEAQIAEKLLYDIPELVLSSHVIRAVNKMISDNFRYNAVSFHKALKTEIALNTRVLKILVRDKNPETARLVAATVASTIDQMVTEIVGHDYIHIISIAEKGRQSGLNEKQLWFITVVGGILLGMGLILLYTISQMYVISSLREELPATNSTVCNAADVYENYVAQNPALVCVYCGRILNAQEEYSTAVISENVEPESGKGTDDEKNDNV